MTNYNMTECLIDCNDGGGGDQEKLIKQVEDNIRTLEQEVDKRIKYLRAEEDNLDYETKSQLRRTLKEKSEHLSMMTHGNNGVVSPDTVRRIEALLEETDNVS